MFFNNDDERIISKVAKPTFRSQIYENDYYAEHIGCHTLDFNALFSHGFLETCLSKYIESY